MKFGDTIHMEMKDADGESIFGAIDQKVVEYKGPNDEVGILALTPRQAGALFKRTEFIPSGSFG